MVHLHCGEGGEVIPHVFVDVKIIPARAFFNHEHIVEVICHDKVETIEQIHSGAALA